MVQSVYPQLFKSVKPLLYASVAHDPLVKGRVVEIQLPKKGFLTEMRLMLGVTQNFSTPPASFDPAKAIERLQIKLKGGNLIDIDGNETIIMGRMRGGATYKQVTLGAQSSAKQAIDIHFKQQGALHDLLTALHCEILDTFTLVITLTASGGFVGGVPSVAAAAIPAVVANPAAVPPVLAAAAVAATPATNQLFTLEVDGMFMHDYDGDASVGGQFQRVSSISKFFEGGGKKDEIKLVNGGENRFIMLTFYTQNADGTFTPNDNILHKLSLKIGNKTPREYDAFDLKADTSEASGIEQTGVVVIDAGDEETEFVSLISEKGSLLLEATAGAPAKWMVRVMQCENIDHDVLLGA
jgi:hypothetical protein